MRIFVSYTELDRKIAEWIAWVLEDAGHKVVLQAWDFLPGSDFVLSMHNAILTADRTLLVFSQNALESSFTSAEWSAMLATDPIGEHRRLIPVKIDSTKPEGLLATRVYVDLHGKKEDDARDVLLACLDSRAKPMEKPSFAVMDSSPPSDSGSEVVSRRVPLPI